MQLKVITELCAFAKNDMPLKINIGCLICVFFCCCCLLSLGYGFIDLTVGQLLIIITAFSLPSLQVVAICFIRKLLDLIYTDREMYWLDSILPSMKEAADIERKSVSKIHLINFVASVGLVKFSICTWEECFLFVFTLIQLNIFYQLIPGKAMLEFILSSASLGRYVGFFFGGGVYFY